MFKRMSVLVRLPGHTRAQFSSAWQRHAAPVKNLPNLRGYIQNHVEAGSGSQSPVTADGFVELLWDSPEHMAMAFASPAAAPMAEDEVNFLGHASGYALKNAEPLRECTGGKLIVTARNGKNAHSLCDMELELRALLGLELLIRDDVVSLIPKPNMASPQPVDAFFHAYFHSHRTAHEAFRHLQRDAFPPSANVGIFKVRTIRFV